MITVIPYSHYDRVGVHLNKNACHGNPRDGFRV